MFFTNLNKRYYFGDELPKHSHGEPNIPTSKPESSYVDSLKVALWGTAIYGEYIMTLKMIIFVAYGNFKAPFVTNYSSK